MAPETPRPLATPPLLPLLPLLLLLAGCAGTAMDGPAMVPHPESGEGPAAAAPFTHASTPASPDAVERVDRVREAYRAGMRRVLEASATDPRTATYWPLRGLSEFWRGSVVWAEASGDGYRPLEPPRGRRAWVAVVPATHGASAGPGRLLQVEPMEGGHVIRIRPERVTDVWAGLFLVHELTHLADRVLWGETAWPSRHKFLEAELRAVEMELAAATALSGGGLTRSLDGALARLRPRSIHEAVERIVGLSGESLDALAPPGLGVLPASTAERFLRRAFLRAALVLRYGARQDLDREMLLYGLDTLLLMAPE